MINFQLQLEKVREHILMKSYRWRTAAAKREWRARWMGLEIIVELSQLIQIILLFLLSLSLGMIELSMECVRFYMCVDHFRTNQIWLGLRESERNEYRTEDNGSNGINSQSLSQPTSAVLLFNNAHVEKSLLNAQ